MHCLLRSEAGPSAAVASQSLKYHLQTTPISTSHSYGSKSDAELMGMLSDVGSDDSDYDFDEPMCPGSDDEFPCPDSDEDRKLES